MPPRLLSGLHYRVRDQVAFFGSMHHFVVDSDYGVFRVTGDMALRKLIREIGAIASLKEFRTGAAYLKGVKKAASQPLELGANMLTDPVDAISVIL